MNAAEGELNMSMCAGCGMVYSEPSGYDGRFVVPVNGLKMEVRVIVRGINPSSDGDACPVCSLTAMHKVFGLLFGVAGIAEIESDMLSVRWCELEAAYHLGYADGMCGSSSNPYARALRPLLWEAYEAGNRRGESFFTLGDPTMLAVGL